MRQKQIVFPSGEKISALCMGTWYLGENAGGFSKEVALVREVFDSGCRVFDTAESYGNGGAERVLGEALKDCRKDVFLISKVLPENGGYDAVRDSCAQSLERLQTDCLDMYMMHWYGHALDLNEMYEAFRDLRRQKMIRYFGVCNFDADELNAWIKMVPKEELGACQLLCPPLHRNHCRQALNICRKNGVPVMVFFPYESGHSVFESDVLKKIAEKQNVTPLKTAAAWTFATKNTGIVFKAQNKKDVRDVFRAADIVLSPRDKESLNETFPIFS